MVFNILERSLYRDRGILNLLDTGLILIRLARRVSSSIAIGTTAPIIRSHQEGPYASPFFQHSLVQRSVVALGTTHLEAVRGSPFALVAEPKTSIPHVYKGLKIRRIETGRISKVRSPFADAGDRSYRLH